MSAIYKVPHCWERISKMHKVISMIEEQYRRDMNFLLVLSDFIVETCCLVYNVKVRAEGELKDNAKEFRITANNLCHLLGKQPRKQRRCK